MIPERGVSYYGVMLRDRAAWEAIGRDCREAAS